ncbi:MAG TPA: type 1 glutamine amidotransferase domain-containing protein [Cellvibrio sp.]|nr:type 1 glutamine amidotransferase domain-containing protein [Cellvibrio sp.]
MIKKFLLGFSLLVVALVCVAASLYMWATAFFPDARTVAAVKASNPADIEYLKAALPQNRGKILAIVSSARVLGNTGKPTGYELSELARAYWVFTVNGFEVDVASPEGGEPYALLDEEDMGKYDYAFLNDSVAQAKTKNTLMLKDINPDDYKALYFVGGKGAMFDFPQNTDIQRLVLQFSEQHKTIAAVCHGPAALLNVKDSRGNSFVAGKQVSAFTNSEELLLIPDAETIFPFLLQTELQRSGAIFIAGSDYLNQVVQEDYLITGQNPWSVWSLAEKIIQHLGYELMPRSITPEEHSVALLETFYRYGLNAAEKQAIHQPHIYDGRLILMHSIVALMRGEVINASKLVILADSVRAKIVQ